MQKIEFILDNKNEFFTGNSYFNLNENALSSFKNLKDIFYN